MSRYFDPAVQADLDLLPSDFHGKSDLDLIAQEAEADVVNAFSVPSDQVAAGTEGYRGTRLFVCLAGYDPDPTLADPELVKPLKRAIRDAILWQIAQRDKNPILRIHFANGASNSYREDANQKVPTSARMYLRPFNTTPPPVFL